LRSILTIFPKFSKISWTCCFVIVLDKPVIQSSNTCFSGETDLFFSPGDDDREVLRSAGDDDLPLLGGDFLLGGDLLLLSGDFLSKGLLSGDRLLSGNLLSGDLLGGVLLLSGDLLGGVLLLSGETLLPARTGLLRRSLAGEVAFLRGLPDLELELDEEPLLLDEKLLCEKDDDFEELGEVDLDLDFGIPRPF